MICKYCDARKADHTSSIHEHNRGVKIQEIVKLRHTGKLCDDPEVVKRILSYGK